MIVRHRFDGAEHVSLPQWRSFINVWAGKNMQGEFRKQDEEIDDPFVRMRTLAI
jgi:hypothetical protein